MKPEVTVKYDRKILDQNRAIFNKSKNAKKSKYDWKDFKTFDELVEFIERSAKDVVTETFQGDTTGKLGSFQKVEVTYGNRGTYNRVLGFCSEPEIADFGFYQTGKIGINSDVAFKFPFLISRRLDLTNRTIRSETLEHELVHLKDNNICSLRRSCLSNMGEDHPFFSSFAFISLLRTEGLAQFKSSKISPFIYSSFARNFLDSKEISSYSDAISKGYCIRVNRLNLMSQILAESLEMGSIPFEKCYTRAYEIGEEMFNTILIDRVQQVLGANIGKSVQSRNTQNILRESIFSEVLSMSTFQEFFLEYFKAAENLQIFPAVSKEYACELFKIESGPHNYR